MLGFRIMPCILLVLLILNSNIQATPKTNVCLQRIEHNLSVYRIDSCLYYSYLLAHNYRLGADNKHLTETWYNIAFLNLLEEQYTRAQAAMQIAGQYTTKGKPELALYQNTFWGLYYYKRNTFKQANIYLTEAIRQKASLSHQLQYLLSLYQGDTWYNLYPSRGIKAVEKVIDELNAHKDTACYAYGLSYYLLGSFDYDKYDNENCIRHTEKALRCFEHHRIFCKYWVYGYHLIIVSFWNMGKNDMGNVYFQRLSDILKKNNLLKRLLPDYYYVKGRISNYKLDYREAINAYLKAYNNSNTIDKKKVVENVIECYYYLKQYDQIVQWADSCESTLFDDSKKIMVAYGFLKIGKKEKAFQICDQIKLSSNDKNLYYSLLELVDFYYEAGDYTKTEFYYKMLLKDGLKKFGAFNYNTSIAFSGMAYFYWYGKKDYAKALYYYHRNVYALLPVKYSNNFYELPDISKSIEDKALATALNNKAEALYELSKLRKLKTEKLRDLQASLANWELSFQVAHRYKMSLPRDDQRYAYADLIKHRYLYIVKASLDLYHITRTKAYSQKTFEYAEKSRASLLLSTLRGINAYKMNLLPGTLKKEEDQVWTKTELLSHHLTAEYHSLKPNLENIEQCLNTLYMLKQQQDSLIQIFKQHYPAYYNARYNTEVINADSLQKQLKPDEAVLEYSLSDNNLVIFLLTRNEFKIFTDSLKSNFFIDVETYRKKLSGFSYNDLLDTAVRSYANLANRLYNQLVKPAEPLIKGKKLTIIPDDVLTQIPFESLVTEPLSYSSPASLRNLPYLIRQHAIDYSYSGTLFAMHHKKSAYQNARLLAIAPSYEKINLKQLSAHDSINMRRDSSELLPIPGTLDEVKDIHRIFGGKMLLGKQATEKLFREIANDYDILHLATHGVINNEYPMFSKLVFKPEKDSANDGLLNTYEIYNMQINAPLVVLSACNSGYGKLHKGEGIISLARGFFTAGAKSIVMTLWSIGDKTSSKLMHQFYTKLASRQNIGIAMQNAKLEYLAQTDEMKAHPYFWAGYIILGNANATFEPNPPKNNYMLWIVIGIIFVSMGIFVGKKKWQHRGDLLN